jgi:tricorn protease
MGFQGYIRYPTIFGDAVVFTAEDDLWRVGAEGGRAERLTAGVAEASNAHFAPDGAHIAFTGRDEGPTETYVMPADGGSATRLTYQGARSAVVGWRPDGSAILYAGAGQQASLRFTVLFAVSPEGGEPEQLPYGIAHSIAFGPHGAVALGRNTADPARWKRYRGGTAGYLWVDASGSGDFKRLPDFNTNIGRPCWVGERIYFVSDHEGIGNVYSFLPTGEDLRRHTNQTEFYARGLATDGKRLVYHAGGDLYLLDPDATEGRRLHVELTGTRTHRARKFVPAGQYLDSFAPHPEGHALAVTTRGKAFTFGNWDGSVLQHGAADGTRYRLLTWLHGGKRLAAIADDGTEPRLAVLTADGSDPDRVLDGVDVGTALELRASPTAEQVALVNHRNEVMLVDVAAGTARVLDRSAFARSETSPLEALHEMRGIAWSPDGRWLAYTFAISASQTAIKVAEVATGATQQMTKPVLHDFNPAFDPGGKYLYFISARDFDPVAEQLQMDWGFPRGIRPYLVTLRRDLASPFVPVPEPPKSAAAEQLEKAEGEEKTAAPAPVAIDFEDIATRIVAFPVPEGRYGRVQGTDEGIVFSSFPVEGTRNKDWRSQTPEANGALEGYHFESYKHERLIDGISDFEVTPNGKTLVYRAADRLRVLKAGEKPKGQEQAEGEAAQKPGRESGWVEFDRVKVAVMPAAEWRQMLGEAWRLQREQFHSPRITVAGWERVRERYAPLVDRIGSRADLSDLFWEMQGELGSSHAYELGGEYRPHPEYNQGFLGVDWRVDPASGRYAIARIVRGDPWDQEATSPLLAPGVNAGVGDAILAVDGQRVTPERGPQQLLVNRAGVQVALLIQPAGGGQSRNITVRTLKSENAARYRDWVEANRQKVRAATGGRVGYLHIPDMGENGFAEFHRQYLAEYDQDALIVDVRWNGGGIVSSLLLEKLMRPRLGYSYPRYGASAPYFYDSPRGPLVALTDENAGSDGDIFSHAFKMIGLGPLVGMRTWGGVVGIEPYLPLADGTVTTQPEFAFWFNDVGWGVENYGTDPTIEVPYPPQAYIAGADPQLERAIAEAQRLMAERSTATPTPERPPFRIYPIQE